MAHLVERGRSVHRERRFELRVVDLPLRGGGHEPRGVVVHPGSVAILALTEAEEIVLIRNHRWTVGETLLEVPAGTREGDEDPLRCAARELREETGWEADALEPLYDFYAAPGVSTERMEVYAARGLRWVGQDLAGDEAIAAERVPVAELPERLAGGAIRDAKTLAVLGRLLVESGLGGPGC